MWRLFALTQTSGFDDHMDIISKLTCMIERTIYTSQSRSFFSHPYMARKSARSALARAGPTNIASLHDNLTDSR